MFWLQVDFLVFEFRPLAPVKVIKKFVKIPSSAGTSMPRDSFVKVKKGAEGGRGKADFIGDSS